MNQPSSQVHLRRLARLLSISILVLAAVGLYPARESLDLTSAPGWARAVVLLALVQIGYACWLWLTPDWSTVWLATGVLTLVAIFYAAACGITIFAKSHSVWILDVYQLRSDYGQWPTIWCGIVVTLTMSLSLAAGTLAYRWTRSTQ